MTYDIAYAWLIAALLMVILLVFWKKVGIRDIPGHRSIHSATTPTAAGVCISIIFLSFFSAAKVNLVHFELPSSTFILGFIILTTIGFIDDWKELNYKIRLLGHALSVGLVLVQQSLSPIEYVRWFFIGVGLVNACNFLDGLNGLLASQWLLTVGFLLSAFAPTNSLFWILWISTLVYLFFNFPKAWVFIGDTGSTILGFSYFTLIFYLAPNQHEFPSIIIPHDSFIIFTLFPLGFAWGDITITIVRRFIDKRSITSSFGDYGFHHKARFFKNHSFVTLIYLALNCILTGIACFLFFNHQDIFLICCIYVIVQLIHWGSIYWLSAEPA
jgi:UDP-N-acetylmuramyl pentapeptide phosphotransferase/UDP-N-acetylglucosamine-1-phosphate transferase